MTTLTLFVTWAHSHLLAPQAALGQRWKHHRQQNHQSIGQVNWPSKRQEFLQVQSAGDDDEAGNLGEDQGLFSAAMPALVTGFLALAFSSLFSQTLSVNATSSSRESFPLLWALPIGFQASTEGRNGATSPALQRRVDPINLK